MSRIGRLSIGRIISIVLIVLPFTTFSSTELDISYQFSSEIHSELDEEINSSFIATISDEYKASNAFFDFDITSQLIFDHVDKENNRQISGDFFAFHNLMTPSARWELEGTMQVIPEEQGAGIDELNSQNSTFVETGPLIVLHPSQRGNFELDAKLGKTHYSDNGLDTRSGTVSFSYIYPVSSVRAFSLNLNKVYTDYDDTDFSQFDSNIDSFLVGWSNTYSRSIINLEIGSSVVDSGGNESRVPILDLSYEYRQNTFSSVFIEILNTVQDISVFNQNLFNPEDVLLQAGVVESQRVEASYNFTQQSHNFSLALYREILERPQNTSLGKNKIDGLNISYLMELYDNRSLNILLTSSINELGSQQSKTVDATLTYSLLHSRRLISNFSLATEYEKNNLTEIRDNIIRYAISYQLM